MIELKVDPSEFLNFLQRLQAPRLNAALAKALADTQDAGAVRAAQKIRERTRLPSETIKRSIYKPSVHVDALYAEIKASRAGISLAKFPTTRPLGRGGVTTTAWGQRKTIKSAWYMTIGRQSYGYGEGIDALGGGGGIRGGKTYTAGGGSGVGHVFVRRTSKRLPIKKLWGPNIFGTFVTPKIAADIRQRMRDRLPRNINRRVRAAMRGYG